MTTKTRIHQAIVLSVLLHTAETWTLLNAEIFQRTRGIAYEMSEAANANQMAPVHLERRDNWVHHSFVNLLSQSAIAATLFSVTLPGCKRTFQRTRHSTATLTYRSDVHQAANGVVAQVVLTKDGLTRFGGTITSRPLTSGGVSSIVVTAGRRYGLYRLTVNDDDSGTITLPHFTHSITLQSTTKAQHSWKMQFIWSDHYNCHVNDKLHTLTEHSDKWQQIMLEQTHNACLNVHRLHAHSQIFTQKNFDSNFPGQFMAVH